jgi:hypothetical protein
MRRLFLWPVNFAAPLAFLALAGGCAHPGTPAERAQTSAAVTRQLAALHPVVDPAEAAQVAQTATKEAAALAAEYRPARPAWFNNILVNAGLRERGLCYHWANELFLRLHPLAPRTLEFHLGVAGRDTSKEHNAVIVTARGQPFREGLVLDAWRHGGRLHAVHATNDTRYPWQPLPRSAMRPDLRELLDASKP